MGSEIKVDDFYLGQRDCERGIPHKSGMSESYDRGYNAQYELEQMKTEATQCQ
jgi:hypothetical protein